MTRLFHFWISSDWGISRPILETKIRPHRRQGHQPPRRRGDESVQGFGSIVKLPRLFQQEKSSFLQFRASP